MGVNLALLPQREYGRVNAQRYVSCSDKMEGGRYHQKANKYAYEVLFIHCTVFSVNVIELVGRNPLSASTKFVSGTVMTEYMRLVCGNLSTIRTHKLSQVFGLAGRILTRQLLGDSLPLPDELISTSYFYFIHSSTWLTFVA